MKIFISEYGINNNNNILIYIYLPALKISLNCIVSPSFIGIDDNRSFSSKICPLNNISTSLFILYFFLFQLLEQKLNLIP